MRNSRSEYIIPYYGIYHENAMTYSLQLGDTFVLLCCDVCVFFCVAPMVVCLGGEQWYWVCGVGIDTAECGTFPLHLLTILCIVHCSGHFMPGNNKVGVKITSVFS